MREGGMEGDELIQHNAQRSWCLTLTLVCNESKCFSSQSDISMCILFLRK